MSDSPATYSIMMLVIFYRVTTTIAQFLPPSVYQNPTIPGGMSAPMAGPIMMPSPMQMTLGYPQQRLPFVVMPFHSKAADKKYIRRKKRRPKKFYPDSESSDDSDSGSCSSSNELFRAAKRKSKHRKKKQQVLTPVISYVTRNGRVVYQKKIKKENAEDWLEIGKKRTPSRLVEEDKTSSEMTIRDLKQKYGLFYKRHDD